MNASLKQLVIVPCGRSKIWHRHPDAGPTPACDVYSGGPFQINRAFAEQFGDAWVILSAKYGFVSPEFVIPGPYEVTFKRTETAPVPIEVLRAQVEALGLVHFPVVIGLGGKEYRRAIEDAFEGKDVQLRFPFAGLRIGEMMSVTKRATERGMI